MMVETVHATLLYHSLVAIWRRSHHLARGLAQMLDLGLHRLQTARSLRMQRMLPVARISVFAPQPPTKLGERHIRQRSQVGVPIPPLCHCSFFPPTPLLFS